MAQFDYLQAAESLLMTVEAQVDTLNDSTDIDWEIQRVGNMMTLTFADRSQIVINLQKPLREVWLASKTGGFHYRFDGTNWQDTKTQGEFFQQLSQDATRHSGRQVSFRPQS
jgi:CyaY protein